MVEVNQGWTIAKYLLTHEREMIGGFGLTDAGSDSLGDIATKTVGLTDGKLSNQILRADIAKWEIDAAAFAFTAERVTDGAKAGGGVGATSAMLKYYGTELNKRRYELTKLRAVTACIGLVKPVIRATCHVYGCVPRVTLLRGAPPKCN